MSVRSLSARKICKHSGTGESPTEYGQSEDWQNCPSCSDRLGFFCVQNTAEGRWAQIQQGVRSEVDVLIPPCLMKPCQQGSAARTSVKTCAGSSPAATVQTKASWIGRLGVLFCAECGERLPTDRGKVLKQ